MRDQEDRAGPVSFKTLIDTRAKSGSLAPCVAFDLLLQVQQAGLRPDVINYNTLISAMVLVHCHCERA